MATRRKIIHSGKKLSDLSATTSAELAGVISDETGTDKVVFNTSPTLVTPLLGTPASGVLTNCTGTAAGLTAGGNVKNDGTVNPTNLLSNGDFENWSAGTSSAPDGWTLSGAGASVAREATIIKLGTYSGKLTRAGTDCKFFTDNPGGKGINYWKSRKITLGCWVYATVADRAVLSIYDNSGYTYSAYHTGSSAWEWLTVTKTIVSNATTMEIGLRTITGDTSAYFDGAMLVEGESAFAFADKPAIDPGIAVGGTGTAGAGKQYVVIRISGVNYKVLHDGTI